jgi:hypothetical protein
VYNGAFPQWARKHGDGGGSRGTAVGGAVKPTPREASALEKLSLEDDVLQDKVADVGANIQLAWGRDAPITLDPRHSPHVGPSFLEVNASLSFHGVSMIYPALARGKLHLHRLMAARDLFESDGRIDTNIAAAAKAGGLLRTYTQHSTGVVPTRGVLRTGTRSMSNRQNQVRTSE